MIVAGLLAVAALAAPVAATSVTPTATSGVELDRIGSFSSPVYVTAPPDDDRRVFVVEQGGTVRVIVDGDERSRPFLDIRDRAGGGGEQGLLSIAFAPDYERSRKLYAYYTGSRGDIFIDEFKRRAGNQNRVSGSSRRNVLRQRHRRFDNHNGGQLQFGPDGRLYAALGDGGGAGDPLRNGQDRGTLLGKLIRIDPEKSGDQPYRTPSSNPYDGRRGKDEIYARGLRNPFRFSFDRQTGDLAIGDVGQAQREEVDFEERGEGRGANFGWSCFEGTLRFNDCRARGHDKPVLQRPHPENCSITGGYVIRDQRLDTLLGRYVYGDFCNGQLRSAKLRPGDASGDGSLGLEVPSLSTFGEDARGRVYAASLDGPVYRLDPR